MLTKIPAHQVLSPADVGRLALPLEAKKPIWTGDFPPPQIGALVVHRRSQRHLVVVGYAVDLGFLSVVLDPTLHLSAAGAEISVRD